MDGWDGWAGVRRDLRDWTEMDCRMGLREGVELMSRLVGGQHIRL